MAASSSHRITTDHHNGSGGDHGSAAEPRWRSDPSWIRRSRQTSAAEASPPMVMVCKCKSADVLTIDTRYRKPDVGIGIKIQLFAINGTVQDFYGEYIGHGLQKTAFLLRGVRQVSKKSASATEHAPHFEGKVLKLAKKQDIEPDVFRRGSPLGVTTSILFETTAIDTDTAQHYHCWITDRCIPLNKICKQHSVIPSNCAIGMYYCLLRAAASQLYITDCGFQNFGLVVNDATEHSIVVIDAGYQPFKKQAWSKKEVNWKVMRKFWKFCEKESGVIPELQTHWRGCPTVSEALPRAKQEWQKIGQSVSRMSIQANAIAAAITSREEQVLALAKQTPAYKIISAVGRAVAKFYWCDECATQCCRASGSLCLELSISDEAEITELYSRLHGGTAALDERIECWVQIDEFRQRHIDVDALSTEEADELLFRFRKEVLWHELTPEQAKLPWRRQNSILFKILRDRAGYKHAAAAIMRYGLPRLSLPHGTDDIEQQMMMLSQFAASMVKWLQNFAAGMRSLSESKQYQKQVEDSARALQSRDQCHGHKRWRR